MKKHEPDWHPGPWRVMRVDSEIAGLLVAIGFLVMGFVSMPIAAWFVSGALWLGGAIALLLHFVRKTNCSVAIPVGGSGKTKKKPPLRTA